jgi:hypothetical protein
MPPMYNAAVARPSWRKGATSDSSPMASNPPAAICNGAKLSSRWAEPASSEAPKTSLDLSGTKNNGSHPSAISAVMATFFSPRAATQIGMRARWGCPMIFRALPRPVPCPSGSGI